MKSVAIITRTKNRPITLERTMRSIAAQTFKDFQWVIVNDGGNKDDVESVVQPAIRQNIDVVIIHNQQSLGMEACSNQGINASQSKYIAFIDDDDTWHPDFLSKTVTFLNDQKYALYKGVVTYTTIVEEKLKGDKIVTIRTYPHDSDLDSITLLKLSRCRSFPNLSFLYYREVLDKIGLYREDMPVMGDWEFNLRFLRAFDVGLLPEYLANYHKRKMPISNTYSQSNVNNFHYQHYMRLKNELLRDDMNKNIIGIGYLVNFGYEINQLERMIKRGSIVFIFRNIKKMFIDWICSLKLFIL